MASEPQLTLTVVLTLPATPPLRYYMMKKMHLPEMAIRMKAQSDGLPPVVIDQIFA